MRLRYQSMFSEDRAEHYLRALEHRLDTTAPSGAKVEVVGSPGGRAQAYHPLTNWEMVTRAERAQADGSDAFLVGNITDPGCAAARASVDVPVLGLGEVSAHTACLMGRRFSSIAADPSLAASFERVVDRVGVRGRFGGTYLMPKEARLTPDEMLECYNEPASRARIVSAWTATARRAVADGANILIATGGIVMDMLTSAGVHRLVRVPVLDGPAILVRMGVLAASTREASGVWAR